MLPDTLPTALRGLVLMYVNHDLVTGFNVANMYFNFIRENKIITKISEFTVCSMFSNWTTSGAEQTALLRSLCSASLLFPYTWVKVQNFQNPELLKFKS